MKLRDYQDYAVDSWFKYYEKGNTDNTLIQMPTGTGKSLVIAGIISKLLQQASTCRIMILTHVKELITQDYDKLIKVWPNAPAGIYSSGLGLFQTNFPIIFAGIASVYNKASEFPRLDIIFVDEAHLISLDEESMYLSFIAAKKAENPHLVVTGLTATGWREGQGQLTEGDNALFQTVICDMCSRDAFNWFIDTGYLVPLVPYVTSTQYDVSKVKEVAGEFNQKQLQNAVDKDDLTRKVVRETIEKSGTCFKLLVFASGIKHTEHVAAIFEEYGENVTFVHSKMKETVRDDRIADFLAGKHRIMVNNGILTTGFDDPEIDGIIIMRPTKSSKLWVQILGRGTRPFYADGFDLETDSGRLAAIKLSQKPVCLVLDFAKNTERLGPINDPVMPKKKGERTGDAPIRICDACGMYNHASATSCFMCGHEFPRHIKIDLKASRAAVIARDEPPQVVTVKVDKVTYKPHYKEGKPPSLQVTYYCGLNRHREYICLEHQGFPAKRARDWWRERYDGEVPSTTLEAYELVDKLKAPNSLDVWINKKQPEIMRFHYE